MADIPYGFTDQDVARIAAAVRGFEGATPRQGHIPGAPLPDRNFTRIPFRNTSSETIPGYAVMRVTGMVTVGDTKLVTVAKPNTSLGRLYLVNGPTPVPQYVAGDEPGNGIGTWLWHASDVLYDTGNTPAYGESWGPQNNIWTLKKNRYGFTIKGGNSGSGATSKTIAVQHLVNEVRGKTSGAIASGASGTVNVYDGAGSIITGTTISATNLGSSELADDTAVVCVWCGGTWCIPGAGGTEDTGDIVDMVQAKSDEPNVDNFHDGQVTRFDSGIVTQPVACWLLFADDYDDNDGAITAEIDEYYGPARKSGTVTSASSTRDLYVCRRGSEDLDDRLYRGSADAAIAPGATGTVSRFNPGTDTDGGTNDSVKNYYNYIQSAATVQYVKLGANKYAFPQPFEIHRGVTSSTGTKGGTCTVDRYTDGTNDDSLINDTVTLDFSPVSNGVLIAYYRLGSNFYQLRSASQTLKIVLGTNSPRVKSGNTQIEASCINAEVDTAASSAYEDKVPLTSTCQ